MECLRDNNSPIGGRIRENHPKRTTDGIIIISISAVHNLNFLNWKWCCSDFSEIQHRIIIYCVHVCYQTNVSKYNNVLSVANTDEIREQAVFMFFLIVDVSQHVLNRKLLGSVARYLVFTFNDKRFPQNQLITWIFPSLSRALITNITERLIV